MCFFIFCECGTSLPLQVPGWPHVAFSMAPDAVHMSHDSSDRLDPASPVTQEERFEPPCVQRKLVMHTRLGLSEPRIDWTNIVPSQDRDQYELAMRQHADSSADVPDQGCT